MTNEEINKTYNIVYITKKNMNNIIKNNNTTNINKEKYIYSVAYYTNYDKIKQLIEIAYYENLQQAINHLYILYSFIPEFTYMDYHIVSYVVNNNNYENIKKIFRIKK